MVILAMKYSTFSGNLTIRNIVIQGAMIYSRSYAWKNFAFRSAIAIFSKWYGNELKIIKITIVSLIESIL